MSQMLQHTSNKAYARDVNNWLATNMWPAHRDARVNDDTDPNTKTDAGILLLQEADPSSNVHKYLCGKGLFELDANVPLFPVDGANTPKIKALYQTSPPMALSVQSLREVSNTPATYPAGFLRNRRPEFVLVQANDKGLKSEIINIAAKPQRQTIRAYFGQLFHIVGTISLDSFLLNAILSIYIPTIGVQRTCQVAGDLTNVAGVVVTLDDPLINGLLNFDLNDMGEDLRLVVTVKLNIALIGQFRQTDILIMTMPQPQQTDTPTPLPAPTPAPAPSPGPKPEPKITPRTSRKGDQGSGLPKGGRMKKPAPMAPQLLVPSTPPLRSAEDFLSPANDGQANTDDELEPEDE
ncbi:hypothetical protein RhiTH_011069 [Rhizoctonia solani]